MSYGKIELVGFSIALLAAVGAGVYVAQDQRVGTEPVAESTKGKAVSPVAAVSVMDPVTDQDRRAAEALVKNISQDKAVVTDIFRGPTGFVGVVINPGENKFIGWMPASRDTLLVGAMFDQTGKNITQAEMVARGFAKTDPTPSEKEPAPQKAIGQAVEKAAGFTEGTAGPIVTAFVDFNCSFCREFYVRSRPFIAAGTMRVRWVPVAILADTSMAKAAAVLGNSDPVTAMALAEAGRLEPISAVSVAMQEKIGGNTAVLNMLSGGNAATPTLITKRTNGSYNVSQALPRDLLAYLKDNG